MALVRIQMTWLFPFIIDRRHIHYYDPYSREDVALLACLLIWLAVLLVDYMGTVKGLTKIYSLVYLYHLGVTGHTLWHLVTYLAKLAIWLYVYRPKSPLS